MRQRLTALFFLLASCGDLLAVPVETHAVRITTLEKENSSLKRQIHALKVDHELLEERIERLQKEFERFKNVDLQEFVSQSSEQSSSEETTALKELELEVKNLKQRTLNQYEALIKELKAITSSPQEEAADTLETYTVRPGDTLERIARRYNISIKALKEANSLSGDKIIVGRKLKIPSAS